MAQVFHVEYPNAQRVLLLNEQSLYEEVDVQRKEHLKKAKKLKKSGKEDLEYLKDSALDYISYFLDILDQLEQAQLAFEASLLNDRHSFFEDRKERKKQKDAKAAMKKKEPKKSFVGKVKGFLKDEDSSKMSQLGSEEAYHQPPVSTHEPTSLSIAIDILEDKRVPFFPTTKQRLEELDPSLEGYSEVDEVTDEVKRKIIKAFPMFTTYCCKKDEALDTNHMVNILLEDYSRLDSIKLEKTLRPCCQDMQKMAKDNMGREDYERMFTDSSVLGTTLAKVLEKNRLLIIHHDRYWPAGHKNKSSRTKLIKFRTDLGFSDDVIMKEVEQMSRVCGLPEHIDNCTIL